jgi:DNA segregation ATPase FtsK/SpoIIIE-like protein
MYLLDYKEGVAFSVYADYGLPHAKVIAIESERELGLSVLKRLQSEMEHRGALFNEATTSAGHKIEDLPTYRKHTGKKLPRIVLIIDEFQKLFEESDMLANKAGNMLDDIARRGRAFGVHVILGSQSVLVANMPKTNLRQFATRVVLGSPKAKWPHCWVQTMSTRPNCLNAREVIYKRRWRTTRNAISQDSGRTSRTAKRLMIRLRF